MSRYRLCTGGDYVYAYLHNDDAPELASPEPVKPSTSCAHAYSINSAHVPELASPKHAKRCAEDRLKPSTSSAHAYSTNSAHAYSFVDVDSEHSVIKIPPAAKKARTVKTAKAAKEVTDTNKLDNKQVTDNNKLGEEFLQHVAGRSNAAASRTWSSLSACSSQASDGTSDCSSHVGTDIGKEDFVLRPGSFRVLLCVDNQEFYAKYVLSLYYYYYYYF